jgi:hypothetical protein
MNFWTIWFAIGIITAVLTMAVDSLSGHGKDIPVWAAMLFAFMSVFGPFLTIFVIIISYVFKNKKNKQ